MTEKRVRSRAGNMGTGKVEQASHPLYIATYDAQIIIECNVLFGDQSNVTVGCRKKNNIPKINLELIKPKDYEVKTIPFSHADLLDLPSELLGQSISVRYMGMTTTPDCGVFHKGNAVSLERREFTLVFAGPHPEQYFIGRPCQTRRKLNLD